MRDNGVLVIAEAGVNHNGSVELAKELAKVACKAGADIVKYQIFSSDKLVTSEAEKAAYQKASTGSDESQASMLRKLELTRAEFVEIKEYCDCLGIEFLATPFDADSLRFLVDDLGATQLKVPSGEMNNYPLLVQTASYGLPVIMSCGMATIDEVKASVNVLKENGAGVITLLHCNTQYPTPYCDVNLRAMCQIGAECGCSFGYSDHTLGIEVPVAAVALGATVIEKHFTLSRSMEGPDHKASLEPNELAAMVSSIRNVEQALGSAQKVVTASESANRAIARKSIVASRPIAVGELLSERNLTTKRPGTGIDPMRWKEVVGQHAVRAFAVDEAIEL